MIARTAVVFGLDKGFLASMRRPSVLYCTFTRAGQDDAEGFSGRSLDDVKAD